MVIATNLGFPRIGRHRELKRALESYWQGRASAQELQAAAAGIRAENWKLQAASGLDHIPSNDFSLYDHVLDTAVMVGAIPDRFLSTTGLDLDTYFRMARGSSGNSGGGIAPLEMTKWFDTNYHYIVPELTPEQRFSFAFRKVIDEFTEAAGQGLKTRPVLIGPVSFLLMSKIYERASTTLHLLDRLVPVYGEVLAELARAGAEWVQIDEPCLVLDSQLDLKAVLTKTYDQLVRSAPQLKMLLATYFAGPGENLSKITQLPVAGLHVDLVRGQETLPAVLQALPSHMVLSAGVVDGRNVWRCDLNRELGLLEIIAQRIGPDRIMVAPSCSLIHTPVDLETEHKLDSEMRTWLSFAVQKLYEIRTLADGLRYGRSKIEPALTENAEALESRRRSPRIHNEGVKIRLAEITGDKLERPPSGERKRLQRAALQLPLLPTTTIGSFPQTKEVRKARADMKSAAISKADYEQFLREEIARAIEIQEEIGLDVLVHGEFERTDMVEYFAEQLAGFAITAHGWVQSYGSRYVKPPIIYGDVYRTGPMTVKWSTFAQSRTSKPVKGMLTGPVTILQWSFVRDDQPRSRTCSQIALAMRDEACDLERHGIRVIQIDEPALREGLPLHRQHWAEYLGWAVESFRLCASGVGPETQIHTHMCYAEFNDIIDAIAALDADVISIESSRSRMELLEAFKRFDYPNDVGPGVYDIHSPRIPSQEEIEELIRKALAVIPVDKLWANPDCGLKTRNWEEVKPSLQAMVNAARKIRAELLQSAAR